MIQEQKLPREEKWKKGKVKYFNLPQLIPVLNEIVYLNVL